MKTCFSLFLALGLLTIGGAAAAENGFLLVRDGADPAPIVVFEGAPPKTVRAAEELADYIEKISGARPELMTGQPDPIPERAVWVGVQPVLEEIFPNLDLEFAHPEEILIAAQGGHLLIAGRDRWNDDHLIVEGRRRTIEGVQMEYGTVNAVYTFLQDQLGVRWLWPGPMGEDLIAQETIEFEPFEYRYHPQIRARAGLFNYSTLGNERALGADWTRFQRLKLSSLAVRGGHAFNDWWDRFHETHPDYFALQPDGTRSGYPNSHNVKMCKSNPELWQQWLSDVEAALEADPNQTVFSASPNDGWRSGYCICAGCLAWDHPEAEPFLLDWQGLSQDYVALSDRQVTFANTLARLLKEKYPDEDYYVQIHAYGPSRPAPVEAVPDDNVIISSVANFILRGEEMRGEHMAQFEAWSEKAPLIVWRPNTGSPVGWQQGLPDVPFRQVMHDFRYAAERNCVGIFVDMVWEHWATQGPLYYLMAQLAWDPYQDGEAVLDDYCRRAFGPAYEEMKAYWDLSFVKKMSGCMEALAIGPKYGIELLCGRYRFENRSFVSASF